MKHTLVTFIEQLSFHSLDIREDKWYHQFVFQINMVSLV